MSEPATCPDQHQDGGGQPAEYDGELDPRVQEELERLNQSSNQINSFEVQLNQAREAYRSLLQNISVELKHVEKQLGSCVKKARPYYEARSKYRYEKEFALRASERFEHAVSRHAAAREMVTVAESSLTYSKQCRPDEKLAWAEMLNSATEKVNAAELERLAAFEEHTQRLRTFQDCERVMNRLQKSLKRNILNSKPYFELKAERMKNVEERKTRVNSIEQNLALAKSDYAAALRTLETISEQIHLQRRLESLEVSKNSRRPPTGVGGEEANNSDVLNVPDRPNSEQTSFRSILSDMNRADSVDHLDNMSDPTESDRLSVDSGMWTPGSGGSAPRGVQARLRPRQHTLNGLTSLSTGNINAQADAIAEVPQRLSNSSAYGSTETTGSSGGASPNNTTTAASSSSPEQSAVVLDVRELTTRR